MSHIMCNMSHVMCQLSRVRCHVSGVTCHHIFFSFFSSSFFIDKVLVLVGGGSVINGATPSSFKNYLCLGTEICIPCLATFFGDGSNGKIRVRNIITSSNEFQV